MAEVLHPTMDGRQSPFYQHSSNHRQSSPARSSIYLGSSSSSSSSSIARSSSTLGLATGHAEHNERVSSISSSPETTSSLASRPSTSDLSQFASNLSTPISSVSLEDKYSQEPDFEDDFPHFEGFSHPFGGTLSEASDEQAESTITDTTASDSPLPTPTVSDDTAIRHEPSQHVDYLSHEWKEEDVWSSWRHIVSQRRVYGQQSRLENAAWRTWVKSKYQLPTVSPETLNWLKESDVTWLYGPLTPAAAQTAPSNDSAPESALSKNNSFIRKKPILKKRSMSEVMLQRSISASSLVKQAAASVQAQGRQKPGPILLPRRHSEFMGSGYNTEAPSRDVLESLTVASSSGARTPSCECKEKRHIRFDDTVEQCIAVEVKPEDSDSDSDSEDEHDGSSSDSEEEGLVMRKLKRRPKLKRTGTGGSGRPSSYNGRKIIETLPSTTLKYRTDSPDVSQQQQPMLGLTRAWSSGHLSPSPSQETLRPSHSSKNFLLSQDDEDDDEAEQDGDSGWSFGRSNPKSSLGASAGPSMQPTLASRRMPTPGIRQGEADPDNDYFQGIEEDRSASASPGSLRRTESGMLMPYEEDEDDIVAAGLFGRISDTVNTAKDIAHVIWNVGWRK